MGDLFHCQLLAASVSYWYFVDRKLTHTKALNGYLPTGVR
jgi:hypothetical protein